MSAPPPLQPSTVVTSSSAPQPPQTWFQRHWKAVVVTILVLVVASILALVAGIVGLVMWSMRQSDVFRMAMEQARKNPEVVQRLGTPIEPGWLVSGSIQLENDAGTAHLTIPIHGPSQQAKMYLDARKRMGEWTFNSLVVKTAAGDEVDVMARKPDRRNGTIW
jgi:hypothetical protein